MPANLVIQPPTRAAIMPKLPLRKVAKIGKKRLGKYKTKAAKSTKQSKVVKQDTQIGVSQNSLRARITRSKIAAMQSDYGNAVDVGEILPVTDLKPEIVVQNLLQDRLVDAAALYQHLRQAHWNIRSESFAAWHEFFDRTLWESANITDKLAERLAALGGYPNAALGEFGAVHALPDYPSGITDANDHLDAIHESLTTLAMLTKQSIDIAANMHDEATGNLFTEIQLQLDKLNWQVKAGIDGGVTALHAAQGEA